MKALACLAAIGISAVALATTSQKEPEKQEAGRYQLITNNTSKLYFLDTKTGRIWSKLGNYAWKELDSPVVSKKAEKEPNARQ